MKFVWSVGVGRSAVLLNLNLQSDLENYTVACYVSHFCNLCGKRIKTVHVIR
jgi:hypothetical protein